MNVLWLYFLHNTAQKGPKAGFDSDITLDLEVSASRLLERRDEVVADVLREVFFAMNWPDVASTTDNVNSLLQEGYGFNFWTWG
jgi:hypothetical protein